jgi:hypothetical protein
LTTGRFVGAIQPFSGLQAGPHLALCCRMSTTLRVSRTMLGVMLVVIVMLLLALPSPQ